LHCSVHSTSNTYGTLSWSVGLTHKEDVSLNKAEAEEHHQVALLIDHVDQKSDDKVLPQTPDHCSVYIRNQNLLCCCVEELDLLNFTAVTYKLYYIER
jgi:hypothetical protein